jgi:hypothetical protein
MSRVSYLCEIGTDIFIVFVLLRALPLPHKSIREDQTNDSYRDICIHIL